MSKKEKEVEEVTEEVAEQEEPKKFKITDLYKNKQYYAITNLVFWFGVLLILVIVARATPTNTRDNTLESDDLEVKSEFDGYDYIKNKNFNFKYTLSEEKTSTIFEGKQFQNKLLFKTMDESEYFIQDSIILKKQKESFVLSDNPCLYFDYLDVDFIEKILMASTKDDDGGYILQVNDFLKLIEKEEIDTDSVIYIELTMDSENRINKIGIDFSEYIGLIDSSKTTLELNLEYSDFGSITDFDIKK